MIDQTSNRQGAYPGYIVHAEKDLVVGVHELIQHLVRSGAQPGQVNRVVVTCICPPPRQVVKLDVQDVRTVEMHDRRTSELVTDFSSSDSICR